MSVCRSVLATLALASLGAAPLSSTQSPASFPTAEMMTVGVYYYPEAWPHEQWERDLANIRKHGFEFVHMAEFAWAFMEPQDGRFDFEWLERAVRLAAGSETQLRTDPAGSRPPGLLTWMVAII
jgi:beta-galactosidase